MRAVRLAVSLILIPRLFGSLLLLPLLLSLTIVILQLITSQAFLFAAERSPASSRGAISETNPPRRHSEIVKRIVFGQWELPPLELCRWQQTTLPSGATHEAPPQNAACSRPDRLDVAILVDDPLRADVSQYTKIFEGNTFRLHVCRDCRPDVVIDRRSGVNETRLYSTWGTAVSYLGQYNEDLTQKILDVHAGRQGLEILLGSRILKIPGFESPINLSELFPNLILVGNISALIIITLWLALKAHRRILDYFARNGALLPMVAATGKDCFYSALWILTFFRVGAFLAASVPLTLMVLWQTTSLAGTPVLAVDIRTFLWLMATCLSLGFAAVVASVADLQQRHGLFTFLYRYVPLLVCVLGGLVWGVTFIFLGETAGFMRNIITALPLIGSPSILLAAIFQPPLWVFLVHGSLTFLLISLLIRQNADWFAAHLEEL